jgi:hypothetical protein
VLRGLRRLERRHRHQRPEARSPHTAQRHQPLPDDAAVLAPQRNEVTDGGECGEGELVLRRVRIVVQGLRQLQYDAGGAQLGAAVAAQRGVHDHAVRQDLPRPVMVGDHHVDSGGLRRCDLGHRGDAAVDGHEQLHAAGGEPLHGGQRQPVALVEAARELPDRVAAESAQCAHQHCRGAHAIDVVVAEHGDLRTAPQVVEDQLAGRWDARES